VNKQRDNINRQLPFTPKSYTIGFVTSKDSTTIGYKQFGEGQGLIIMHGGIQASQNFTKLATVLSDEFTVYIPDRRGRGLSGPPGENYSMKKECEDVEALVCKTGAYNLFGLSSGALISLYAARTLPNIHKVVLYEPPISIDNLSPNQAFVSRYEREIAEGKVVSAFITVLKGLHLSRPMTFLPRCILVPFFKNILSSQENEIKIDKVLLKELIPTWHFDNLLVNETKGILETYIDTFKNVKAKVLLMSGSKSPSFLKEALKKLNTILPYARYVEFPGLDHSGPDNSGNPELVASELRLFFDEANDIK